MKEALIIGVVVAGIGVGYYFYDQNEKKKKAAAAPKTPVVPPKTPTNAPIETSQQNAPIETSQQNAPQTAYVPQAGGALPQNTTTSPSFVVPNTQAPVTTAPVIKPQAIKVVDALKSFKYDFAKETVSFMLNGIPIAYQSIFARDTAHKTFRVPKFEVQTDRWNSPKDALFKIIISSVPEKYKTVISFKYDGGVDSEESVITDSKIVDGNWVEVTKIRLDEFNAWSVQSQNDEIKLDSTLQGLRGYAYSRKRHHRR